MGEMPFHTDEALLALCLITAGCEPFDPAAPCVNVLDAEIIFKLGGGQRDPQTKEVTRPSRFAGMTPWDAAQQVWKEGGKGDVRYSIKLTSRCSELIKAYRNQEQELKTSDKSSGEVILEIMEYAKAGAMMLDEAILRITCVNLKTRIDFVNHWKKMVPLLRVQRKGKSRTMQTTAMGKDGKGRPCQVPATRIIGPGFDAISLNAGEELRKQMGFA